MGEDQGDKGGLLDSLLDDASKETEVESKKVQLDGLLGAVRKQARVDSQRDAEEQAAAAARAAQRSELEEQARAADRDAARSVIGAVLGTVRQPDASVHGAEETAVAGRIRRPADRFGPDDLLKLAERDLLAVVTQMEPLDLVLVCASRGAGELTDRLLALLPDGTRQALFEAIKAAGITPDEEARAAFQRVSALVAELSAAPPQS